MSEEVVQSKPSVLGKGLASLLPGASGSASVVAPLTQQSSATAAPGPVTASVSKDRHPGIAFVGLEEIKVNPYQPRQEFKDESLQELTQSIRVNGIIQPLVLRKTEDGYQLIAGERRLRAAKLAGLKQVPAVIRRSTDRESLELAIIENIQREDLNCIDAALAYFRLQEEFSLTQEEVATRVGKDRVTVSNHLRLLRLPEVVIDDLKQGVLTMGHGKALLALSDQTKQVTVRDEIIKNKWSVREVEEHISQLQSATGAEVAVFAEKSSSEDPVGRRLEVVSRDLTRHWATRVEVRGSEKKGKIILHYRSKDDLDRLLASMQSEAVWRAGRT